MACINLHLSLGIVLIVLCGVYPYETNRTYNLKVGYGDKWNGKELQIHHLVARSVGAENSNDTGDHDHILLTVRNTTQLPCHLHPLNNKIYEHIQELLEQGTKLVQFNLHFVGYDENPMRVNVTWNFKADVWHRSYTNHGKTLLSLAFNYDILSLLTLTFGVETIDVTLTDHPKGCLRTLSENEKVKVALEIITVDFRQYTHTGMGSQLGDDPHTCHEVIKERNGYGIFEIECCYWGEPDPETGTPGVLNCSHNSLGKWLQLLQIIMPIVKVVAILFGPLFFEGLFKSESILKTDYVVKINESTKISQVVTDHDQALDESSHGELKLFKKDVEANPTKAVHHLTFKELHIYIDHRHLMTERSVPVGVIRFFVDNIFLCQLQNWYPFSACCKESVFGSWTSHFLCCKLADPPENGSSQHMHYHDYGTFQKKQSLVEIMSEWNIRARQWLRWGVLANIVGGILLMAAVPIPYYVRLVIYHGFEQDEVEYRQSVLDSLQLKAVLQHNLLHYFTPTHWFWVMIYVVYAICFVLIGIFRQINRTALNCIFVEAIQDWSAISHMECITLLATHILLPFQKFGIFGIFVGVIYWPIALPLCLLVMLFYSVPTIYFIGRLLSHKRPAFIRGQERGKQCGMQFGEKRRTVGDGKFSFESCLLLNTISPPHEQGLARMESKSVKEFLIDLMIGITLNVFMLSMFIMFSEVLGLAVEIFVFTLMGAIINAANATKYVMLSFWIIMYSTACFNSMYERYLKLNKELFDFIKDRMKNEIKKVTVLREDVQKNTAFKYYFTDDEIKAQSEAESQTCIEIDEESRKDRLEYIKHHLHWKLNGLVLFVDRKDVPRIPKQLFHEICDIEAPGCPGPVYLGLLDATKQFLYMILFLIFVIIVVMSFGDVYKVSSSNQMLMTLAGGFVPFILRFVLQPKKGTINLSSYSFEGKVHQIIRDYMQCWPVFNMTFNVIQDAEAEEEEERKAKEEKEKGSKTSLHEEDELKKMDKGTQTERLPELYQGDDNDVVEVELNEDGSTAECDPDNKQVQTEQPNSEEENILKNSHLFVDMDTGKFVIGTLDFNDTEIVTVENTNSNSGKWLRSPSYEKISDESKV